VSGANVSTSAAHRRDSPVFVLIDGAFGVGKTTVARELRRLLPRAALFDPEWVGLALQRLPGLRVPDFQDLRAWRRGTVAAARAVGAWRPTVVVPMAFSDPAILEEIRAGLARSRRPVLHVCLTAPLDVVRARLAARGEPYGDPAWEWVHRRAAECCDAHADPAFAVHVATEGRTPAANARDLPARIRNAAGDTAAARARSQA
jgi:predicted kinase